MNGRNPARRQHSLMLYRADSRESTPIPGTMGDLLGEFTNRLREKALRSAAYAGAKVFYEEMQHRAEGAEAHSPNVKSGTLRSAIYHWHDEDASRGGLKQVYAVGPNKRKAPHWFNVASMRPGHEAPEHVNKRPGHVWAWMLVTFRHILATSLSA